MDVSRQEEIIAALWAIASILSFGFGYNEFGGALALKAGFDIITTIKCAYREIKNEKTGDSR
jgi:hypothetical protein